MGKKSKNPSKKSNKSNANADVAHNSIQELQSGINSMSMNDAFAAVRMATNSINQMKAEQQKAADELKKARAEVERSKIDKSNNDLYADVNFWEKRYKDESSQSNAPEIYEWYLDFEELTPLLLPDITHARQQTTPGPAEVRGEVLVAGCGNSSMCEDLYHAGIVNICGMDYSQSVIDAMNQRLDTPSLAALKTTGGVRYLQADGTKMPKEMSSKCSVVVDKGTLDAITSGGVAEGGGGDATSRGTSDALAYMREMWRVLQPNGVFVIISTMPPHLFHLVGSSVVPALSNETAKTRQQDIRTGDGYRINSFTTKAGGSVFYYALFKPTAKTSGE
jgi:SAM-dependent methyltransferase